MDSVTLIIRDCQQITFVTLNRLCPLNQKQPPPLFLTENIKMDRIPTKVIANTCLFYTVFQVLEVLLIKICKIQALGLLFLFFNVFMSFYIGRYHFSQILKTSFSIICRKDSCHKFFFFNRFIKTPHPLKGQNLLQHGKSFLLMLPKFVIYYHMISALY